MLLFFLNNIFLVYLINILLIFKVLKNRNGSLLPHVASNESHVKWKPRVDTKNLPKHFAKVKRTLWT